MCTVTFLPIKGSDFILTSNRDEDPKRATKQMVEKTVNESIVYFPQDPKAGGSWFASDQDEFTLCLLNGGFEKHEFDPPYRRSRGLMVLDFFEFSNTESFITEYNFEGIEPFTLVLIDHSNKDLVLKELVWDEMQLHVRSLDNLQPHIWSSTSLYPEEVKAERRSWFEEWLSKRSEYSQADIQHFHEFGGKGDAWNNFVMNRNGEVMTVSVTSIKKSGSQFNFEHKSLI